MCRAQTANQFFLNVRLNFFVLRTLTNKHLRHSMTLYLNDILQLGGIQWKQDWDPSSARYVVQRFWLKPRICTNSGQTVFQFHQIIVVPNNFFHLNSSCNDTHFTWQYRGVQAGRVKLNHKHGPLSWLTPCFLIIFISQSNWCPWLARTQGREMCILVMTQMLQK